MIPSRDTRRKPARAAWLIFLASVLVYQANLRPVAARDSLPAALLPFSILLDKSLRLDRFADYLREGQPGTPNYLRQKEHHFYSAYAIAQPVLLTPFYIPLCAALNWEDWQVGDVVLLARICEKLLAGALAAASAAFFFLLLDRVTSRRNALLLSAAYAFGTTTWAISSQALWPHSGGGLLIVLTLLALQRWTEDPARKFLWLAGLCAGLALAVRPTDGLLACVVSGVLLMRREQTGSLAVFLLPVIACGILTASYNFWLFQDVRGYSGDAMSDHFLAGVAGTLFSPGRGLVVYCPFLLFAALGIGAWWRQNRRTLSLLVPVGVSFCVAHLALIGCVPEWWGGSCWGPRLLTEMMPFLVLLIVPVFDAVMTSRWQRRVFWCLLLYSVSLQFVGAFCYPNGRWDSAPAGTDFARRCWDWRDNPIRRTIRGGFVLTPYTVLREGAFHGRAAAVRKIREMGLKGF